MQKYLTQLHEDLIAARRPDEVPEDTFDKENEDDSIESTMARFEEIERYAQGEIPTKKFGDACGVQKIQFPPSEKLTETQMGALCEAINDLIWSWNIDITLPDTLPLDRRYHFLKNVFDTETMLVDDGHIGIELCDYEVEGCVFEEHCMCIKLEEESFEVDEEAEESALFFIMDINDKMALNSNKIPIEFIFEARPVIESETETLQTLAQCLSIPLEKLPDPSKLKKSTVDKITNILLQIWEPNDEMAIILRYLDPHMRLDKLTEYLESEIWFDSVGCMFFVPIPIQPYTSPLDALGLDPSSFDNDSDEEGKADDDLELPF